MFIINQYVLLWQLKKGENCLVDNNDAQSVYISDNSYTIEYLKDVVENSIVNCEKEFICKVRSLGCSVHLNIPNIKDHILFIVNFFRNNHFASKEAGRNKLVVPQKSNRIQ